MPSVCQGVVGGNWIELPAGAYRLTAPDERKSHCQIEVDVAYVCVLG